MTQCDVFDVDREALHVKQSSNQSRSFACAFHSDMDDSRRQGIVTPRNCSLAAGMAISAWLHPIAVDVMEAFFAEGASWELRYRTSRSAFIGVYFCVGCHRS